MTNNPIMDHGFVVGPQEYQWIASILDNVAKAAADDGKPKIEEGIHRFLGRLKQHVFAGEGPPAELLERFDQRLRAAFVAGDERQVRIQLSALVAATYRMDPDPAGKVAARLMEILASSSMQLQRLVGAAVLRQLDEHIQEADEAWSSSSYPDPPQIVAWVRGMIADGADNLQNGIDPWPEESGHDEAAEAED